MKAIYTGRQAIRTRSFGPTANSPSRMIADCEAGRVIISREAAQELSNRKDAHEGACLALLQKLEWDYNYVGAGRENDVIFWVPGVRDFLDMQYKAY